MLPVTLIVGGVPTEPITDLALVIEGPIVRLSWSPVVGATLYHIYKSDEPYSGWSLLGTTTLTSWNLLYNGDRNFFQVTWD
ncbi:hypothetical protein H8D51_02030 [bacterium]|nr:hypothetical protein [bacterium]